MDIIEEKTTKLLMRAGLHPFSQKTIYEIITKNRVGDNIGNLLFPYGISRVLMAKNTTIKVMKIPKEPTEERIAEINATYDAFLIPLANAFRISFIEELKKITAFVKKLTIPCIVIGVGAQASLGKEIKHAELEKTVHEFIDAVLEKSSLVGLRGDFSASYLEKLGYIPEKHFTVIGCPSLYLYGEDLPIPEKKELTPDSKISTNSKMQLPQKFHDFMYRSVQYFSDSYYIPQVIEEVRHMYYEIPIPDDFVKKEPKNYLLNIHRKEHPDFPKPVSFVDATTWINFLKRRDFSFGSRIHGNIAAILAGIPAFIIVSDERIKELVTYHHIPHLMMKHLNEKTDIFELYANADFSQIGKYHKKNYEHYVDFLHKNQLVTAFETAEENVRLPFDRKRAARKVYPALTSFEDASFLGRIRRKTEYEKPDSFIGRHIIK